MEGREQESTVICTLRKEEIKKGNGEQEGKRKV